MTTEYQETLVALVEAVPNDGHWVSYNELTETMRVLGFKAVPRAISSALDAWDKRQCAEAGVDRTVGTDRTVTLWAKVRNVDGKYVSRYTYGGGTIIEWQDHPANTRFIDLGGRLDRQGAAPASMHFPLASHVRLGRISVGANP